MTEENQEHIRSLEHLLDVLCQECYEIQSKKSGIDLENDAYYCKLLNCITVTQTYKLKLKRYHQRRLQYVG